MNPEIEIPKLKITKSLIAIGIVSFIIFVKASFLAISTSAFAVLVAGGIFIGIEISRIFDRIDYRRKVKQIKEIYGDIKDAQEPEDTGCGGCSNCQ